LWVKKEGNGFTAIRRGSAATTGDVAWYFLIVAPLCALLQVVGLYLACVGCRVHPSLRAQPIPRHAARQIPASDTERGELL
jgi:hypothetical protein